MFLSWIFGILMPYSTISAHQPLHCFLPTDKSFVGHIFGDYCARDKLGQTNKSRSKNILKFNAPHPKVTCLSYTMIEFPVLWWHILDKQTQADKKYPELHRHVNKIIRSDFIILNYKRWSVLFDAEWGCLQERALGISELPKRGKDDLPENVAEHRLGELRRCNSQNDPLHCWHTSQGKVGQLYRVIFLNGSAQKCQITW